MTSRRDQKRQVRAGLDALRTRPGWAPVAGGPADGLDALRQADRTEQAYSGAEACAECDAVRRTSGDATALCDAHLAAALGL